MNSNYEYFWLGGHNVLAYMLFCQSVEISKMNCTHLTREERYQIYALKKAGHIF